MARTALIDHSSLNSSSQALKVAEQRAQQAERRVEQLERKVEALENPAEKTHPQNSEAESSAAKAGGPFDSERRALVSMDTRCHRAWRFDQRGNRAGADGIR